MTPYSRIAQGVVAAIMPHFNSQPGSGCGKLPVFPGNVARRHRKRFPFPARRFMKGKAAQARCFAGLLAYAEGRENGVQRVFRAVQTGDVRQMRAGRFQMDAAKIRRHGKGDGRVQRWERL